MFKFTAYFKMTLSSLVLNRLRSFLSILGIVFGVMAVIVIVSVGEGARNEALRQIQALGTRNVYIQAVALTEEKKETGNKAHQLGLRLDDARRIHGSCTTVKRSAALRELTVSVMGTPREITPQVVAVTPSYGDILDLRIKAGRFITPHDAAGLKEICVIGQNIAISLGRQGHLDAILRIENHLFKIVGILDRYHETDDVQGAVSARNYNDMILLPIGVDAWLTRKEKAAASDGQGFSLTELIFQVDQPDNVLDAARVIERIMARLHPDLQDYQIITPLELLHQARRTKKLFSLFLITIASISLVVGGIGIMNIMLATVSERKKEIGIRRAVGARRDHILIQFLAEASILTLAGGLLGICLGAICIHLLSYVIPWESALTLKAIIIPLVISSLTGLAAGLYPAWSAAKMDPIEALI